MEKVSSGHTGLKKLSPKHLRVCFYIARGADISGVARRFDYTLPSLVRLMSDPLIKNQINHYIRVIEERSLAILDDAIKPLHDNLRNFSLELVDIVTNNERHTSTDGKTKFAASDNARLKAISLGFTLVKPSIDKDTDDKKRQPELVIRVKGTTPELKLIDGRGLKASTGERAS